MLCPGCKFNVSEEGSVTLDGTTICYVCYEILWGKCWRKERTSKIAGEMRGWNVYHCQICGWYHRTRETVDANTSSNIYKKVRKILVNLGWCGDHFRIVGEVDGFPLYAPAKKGVENGGPVSDYRSGGRKLVRDHTNRRVRDLPAAARQHQQTSWLVSTPKA